MKMKKEIDALSTIASTVEFPSSHSTPYTNFAARLRQIVQENFGVRSIEWDDHEQEFYWYAEEISHYEGLSCAVVLKRTFCIDPRKPLADEFARVEAEYQRFNEERAAVGQAIYKGVEGVRLAVLAKAGVQS